VYKNVAKEDGSDMDDESEDLVLWKENSTITQTTSRMSL
jgi:hypothetical protein